jgi:hypothetical protein
LANNFERSFFRTQNDESNQKLHISEQIIKTLAQQVLKEEKFQVREVIAAAIGTIGIPEA